MEIARGDRLTEIDPTTRIGLIRPWRNSVFHLADGDGGVRCSATDDALRVQTAAEAAGRGYTDLRPCLNCLGGTDSAHAPPQRECPFCGEWAIMGRHLPCDGVEDGDVAADGGTVVTTFVCPDCDEQHRNPDRLPLSCRTCGARIDATDGVVGDE